MHILGLHLEARVNELLSLFMGVDIYINQFIGYFIIDSFLTSRHEEKLLLQKL